MVYQNGGERKQVRIEELLYYLFIAIMMGAKGIGLTDGQKLFALCMLAAALCWVVKLGITGHCLKEWIMILLFLGLGGMIWLRTGEKAGIMAVMMIMGMKHVPLNRLMKVSLAVWGSTFLFSLLRSLLGFSMGVTVVHEKLGLGPVIRYSMGYTHPNVLHVTYFILVMLIMYCFRPTGKKLYLTAAGLFMGNLYIFLYSISYTGIIIISFYLFMAVYVSIRKNISLIEKALAAAGFSFCVIFPLAGPFLLKGKAFAFFNNLLSTRFELVYNLFSENKISLFGTYIPPKPGASLTLDSSFAYLLMYYGVIAFLFFVGLYGASLIYCLRKNWLQEAAILLGIAVAGITEQFLFNLSFKNIAFFIMGAVLYEGLMKDEGSVKEGRRFERSRWICGTGNSQVVQTVGSILTEYRSIWQDKWKKITLMGLAGAAVMLLLWIELGARPEGVLVGKMTTDYRGEDEFIITDETLESDKEYIRLGNTEVGSRAYLFEGNILHMETLRNITSSVLWGWAGGCLSVSVIYVAARQAGERESWKKR